MTVFGSGTRVPARWTSQGGDVGYVARSLGHYIENTGTGTLRFLEMFRSDHYEDVSLEQWMALTPAHLIREHLKLDDATIAHLRREKQLVVG